MVFDFSIFSELNIFSVASLYDSNFFSVEICELKSDIFPAISELRLDPFSIASELESVILLLRLEDVDESFIKLVEYDEISIFSEW